MTEDTWLQVDRFFSDLLVPRDAALDGALARSVAAGLPDIQVAPTQGMLLHLLALTQGARRILEIGTLGGYSTIWLARALPPGGKVVTIEVEPSHAVVARQNLMDAGVADRVDLREGAAQDVLPRIAAESGDPFDFVFIDADKRSTPAYFTWALRLARTGSLIVVDNVVRRGRLIDAQSDDPDVQGMRRFLRDLAQEKRVRATAIQTVGSKGYDGFALALVLPEGQPGQEG